VHTNDSPGFNPLLGHRIFDSPEPARVGVFSTRISDNNPLPVFVTVNVCATWSPTAETPAGDVCATIDKLRTGTTATRADDSFDCTRRGENRSASPLGGSPDAFAVFSTRPCAMSACVTVYSSAVHTI